MASVYLHIELVLNLTPTPDVSITGKNNFSPK
jgi:hypothetical protein